MRKQNYFRFILHVSKEMATVIEENNVRNIDCIIHVNFSLKISA